MPGSPNFSIIKHGSSVHFSRVIKEHDINTFAELTGDFSPNHMDEDYMKSSAYGQRIAHGALLVGFMSTASSMIVEKFANEIPNYTPVSLGYDRIRFIKPVFINDTINITYEVLETDVEAMRSLSKIEIANQNNDLVAVGDHILKWVPDIVE
jgi:acyl dehydratase